MPAKMGTKATLQGWVVLTVDNHDGKGAQPVSAPPAGQVLGVESADAGDFTASLDATAVPAPPDPTTGVVPVTAGNFTVVSPASPTQPNVPVNISITAKNADGTDAAPALVDTIEVDETLAPTEVLGDLFGVPVASAPAA